MKKTELLKNLMNEIVEIVEYREENKKNLRFWFADDKKRSKARFRRLRLTIEEVLKDIEKKGSPNES